MEKAKVSSKEMLTIICNQWCTVDDLKKLSGMNTTIYRLWNKIKADLVKKNYFLPSGLLPMEEVVKALHIDIKKLEEDVMYIEKHNLSSTPQN